MFKVVCFTTDGHGSFKMVNEVELDPVKRRVKLSFRENVTFYLNEDEVTYLKIDDMVVIDDGATDFSHYTDIEDVPEDFITEDGKGMIDGRIYSEYESLPRLDTSAPKQDQAMMGRDENHKSWGEVKTKPPNETTKEKEDLD